MCTFLCICVCKCACVCTCVCMRRGQGGLLVKFNWKRSDQSVSNSFLTMNIRSHLPTSPVETASFVANLEKLWCEAAPGHSSPLEQVKPLFSLHFPCAASAAPCAVSGAASIIFITFSTRGLSGRWCGPSRGHSFHYVFYTRPLRSLVRSLARPPFSLRFPHAASAAPGAASGAALVFITFSMRGLCGPWRGLHFHYIFHVRPLHPVWGIYYYMQVGWGVVCALGPVGVLGWHPSVVGLACVACGVAEVHILTLQVMYCGAGFMHHQAYKQRGVNVHVSLHMCV